jgi:hypothetical protein
MVDDIRQCNKAQGSNIPNNFITGMEQMARDSKSIDDSILIRLSKLQDLHFGCVSAVMPKESPPTPVVKQMPKKRKRGYLKLRSKSYEGA